MSQECTYIDFATIMPIFIVICLIKVLCTFSTCKILQNVIEVYCKMKMLQFSFSVGKNLCVDERVQLLHLSSLHIHV